MGKHLVVGAGQVGSHLARTLAGQGHEVVQVSRSGSGPYGVAADASDSARLTELAKGADAVYNCVNPAYHRWMTDWPPMAESFLAAARANDSVLVILGNLYVYGPVDGPMTDDLPLRPSSEKAAVRAKIWHDALASGVRTVEVRGSDYFGPGSTDQGYFGEERFLKPLRERKTIRTVWPLDVPHTFTYLPDVAESLAIAGSDPRAWGRAWHVPSNEPTTFREMGGRMAAILGLPEPRMSAMPWPMVRMAGLFSPMVGEMKHVRYQFTSPFVMESADFTSTFGQRATPMDEALRRTLGR
ncbi:NAD-dependent epimerase/dehydratase family protein [Nonomuraea sp. NPDC050663]|uniref:NAD-dependent epimerase/dehydratase family protein n=1 Tax=Nonomuraea sp. NPDC050663 TaxID=3364370 RepID=UPI00378CE037